MIADSSKVTHFETRPSRDFLIQSNNRPEIRSTKQVVKVCVRLRSIRNQEPAPTTQGNECVVRYCSKDGRVCNDCKQLPASSVRIQNEVRLEDHLVTGPNDLTERIPVTAAVPSLIQL
ncbi:MAG: hypothetical protein AUI33_15815 [Ignavibacteria bacterium 13_1_40CM_2_61_4]|nr:MAG: hypothetical protein AUI33_15815 [Ignavibacteria bacterium 13_1_40CM_2_61_4]